MASRLVPINPVTRTPFAERTCPGGATTTIVSGERGNARTLGGLVTVKLPSAPGVASIGGVIDFDDNAATFGITVDGNGKLIDGAATVAITSTGAAACFFYDGTQWRRLVERRALDGNGLEYELVADGSATTPSGNFGALDLETTGSLLIGPTPRATTGTIRLANGQTIQARNAANSADVTIATLDGSDVLQLAPNVGISAALTVPLATFATAIALGTLPRSATGFIRVPEEPGVVMAGSSSGADYAGITYSAASAAWTFGNTSQFFIANAFGCSLIGTNTGCTAYDGRQALTTDLAVVTQYLAATDAVATIAGKLSNLQFPVNAGEVWKIKVTCNLGCSGANGVTLGIDAPVGSTGDGQIMGAGASATTFASAAMTNVNTQYAVLSNVAGAAERVAILEFLLVVGATGGVAGLRFGSVAAAQTSSLFAKAHLEARRAVAV